MRVEFRQGVPEGCREWLNKNVGKGNRRITSIYDSAEYDWFYRRERVYPQGYDTPTYTCYITVKDPKLAMLFVLRWSA